MKNNKNILYLFMMLGILLIFSDGTVSAAMPSYQFPKQISIGKAIWTVKSRGVNVTDDQLATLTEEQQKMGCAKYLPGVEIRKTGDNYKAFINNKRTNKYCEHGYELSFEKATGTAGNLTKDSNGKWVLNVCKYSEENMSSAEAAIQKLINPANIKMEYLPNVKKYKVTFLGMLNNNGTNSGMFKLKRVRQIEVNDSIVWDLSETPSSFTTAGVNPDGVSMTLDPGTEYFVSFYVNGDTPGCEEVYAANIISGTTKSIPNPVLQYTDASGNICSRVYAKYGKQNEADSVVTGAVPFCYRNDIDYREQYPTVNELLSSIANLDAMLSTGKTVSSNKLSTQKCAFVPGSMNTKTTTGSDAAKGAHNYYSTAEAGTTIKNKYLDIAGTYWRAECTEDMTIDYDDPKAVYAGGGFSYTTIIKLTRTCHPVQIRTPRKKALCEYAADCMGKGHTGGPGAGPTEDFDSCISTCDGGKYTQKCINSCYDEIYKNTDVKTVSYTDKNNLGLLSYENRNSGIIPVSRRKSNETYNCSFKGTTSHTPRPVSSCYVIGGNSTCEPRNPGDSCPTCYTEHGVAVWYCNSCNGSGGGSYSTDGVQCYEVYASTTDCSDNPEKDYYEEVIAARNEYNALIARIQEYTKEDYKDEEIKTGVYDSFIDKQINFGTNQQPITNVEITKSTSGNQERMISTVTQDTAGYVVTTDMLKYTWKEYTTTRTQTIHLTQSYVSKDSNQTTGTGTKYQKEKLDCNGKDKDKQLCQKYYDGGYKFYTDLGTPTINDWNAWPSYNPNNTDYSIKKFTEKGEKYENIDVDLINFGSWGQWSIDIDCIYGLYQNFCPNCGPYDPTNPPSDDPNCDPSKDICSGGIQYIYREIHLDDAFPNDRNPRWNWTGTINNRTTDGRKLFTNAARPWNYSYRGYNIDPDALTAHIEKNGYKIYDVKTDSSEVDYEFTLTKSNLKNIRQYNKQVEDFNGDGQKNYLDYDTSCYTRTIQGRQIEVCTNNFLDNEQYITYATPGFSQNERKAIAGCNNAKSGQCYDVSASN